MNHKNCGAVTTTRVRPWQEPPAQDYYHLGLSKYLGSLLSKEEVAEWVRALQGWQP